jgi:hypothetical protein
METQNAPRHDNEEIACAYPYLASGDMVTQSHPACQSCLSGVPGVRSVVSNTIRPEIVTRPDLLLATMQTGPDHAPQTQAAGRGLDIVARLVIGSAAGRIGILKPPP